MAKDVLGILAILLTGDQSEAQVVISSLGTPYVQNFDTLASAGTSSALPTGWAFSESLANANATYTAGTGSSLIGDTYSFGATASTERALGSLQDGALTSIFGAQFQNTSGQTITSVQLTYTGEQWRLGMAGRVDRLDFQGSLSATSLTTGTWTDFDTLDFTAPVTSGTLGALNGNAAANRSVQTFTQSGLNILNGDTFWIRWLDFNASGADDGLAIDDVQLVAVPEPREYVVIAGLGLLGFAAFRRWSLKRA